jgi:hypothetical protein
MPTELKKAVNTLTNALKDDKELYEAYQANIAMSFYDAARDAGFKPDNLHTIANDGADRFLKLLITEQVKGEEIEENIERAERDWNLSTTDGE